MLTRFRGVMMRNTRWFSSRSGDVVKTTPPLLQRFSLEGKVGFVTGGGQGIGRALSHGLADAGIDKLGVFDLNEETAKRTARELEEKGVEAVPVQVDVTDVKQVEAAVEALGPRVDIAVNNAGLVFSSPTNRSEDVTAEQWDATFDLNVKAVFQCSQVAARVMLKNGYGKIVNVASMSGHVVNEPQLQTAYNASKAAVHQLSRSLAAEWAAKGVRVNTISPGYINTELLQKPGLEDLVEHWLKNTPNGRLGEVTDLQGAVLYLCAPASDHVVGADLVVDGGFTLW